MNIALFSSPGPRNVAKAAKYRQSVQQIGTVQLSRP